MPLALAPFMGSALFPAQASLLQPEALASAARNQELTGYLRAGNIAYQIQERPEAKMPRLATLWMLPVALEPIAGCMRDVGRWAEWMPRFSSSEKHPSSAPDAYLQEARMKAAGMTIHYQVLVHERRLDQGIQLYWNLDETGFKKDKLAMGLAINFGSFAAYPMGAEETLIAYSIHTQVSPLLPGTRGKITKATVEEFPQFPGSLASRAINPAWTFRSQPLFRPFLMREAV